MRKRLLLSIIIAAIVAFAVPVADTYAKKPVKSATATKKKAAPKSTSKTQKSVKPQKSAKSQKSSKSQKKETVAEVKKRQEEAQKEIKLTQQQIKENDAAVKKNLAELGKLETDIAAGKKTVADASAKVQALEKQISGLKSKIADDEKRLETLRSEYLKAVKKMRAKRKEQSALAFVFSSGSFNQAMRRMRYLREVSDWRERQTAEINRHVAALKDETDRLARTKQMHDKALSESMTAQKNLETQYARQDAIVVDLKKNGQALRTHLSKKQAEVNELRNRVSALIAEEQRKAEAEKAQKLRAENERKAKAEAEAKAKAEAESKALAQADQKEQKKQKNQEKPKEKIKEKSQETPKKESQGTSYADARKRKPRSEGKSAPASAPTPPSAKDNGFASMKGSLPRPVSGAFKVTSRFGRNSLPDMPDVIFENPGVDAETAPGATALAVYGGKVSGVYMLPGYSTVVIINHDGYYTVYGNLAAASVKVGDNVKQGQGLGKLAPDEDDPTHSVIHFEVWKNRDKQDPLAWIR